MKTMPIVRGDVFGGLAAMLVALPSAIAFGLIAAASLGPQYVAMGALTGILGVIVLGLTVPWFGGAPRLISAPCAPAAAMLAAFGVEFAAAGLDPARIFTLLALVAALAGVLQILFGLAGGGRFIKYIPYPVVAGYMAGVGALILLSQLPRLIGLPAGAGLAEVLHPGLWDGQALLVAAAAIVAMLLAPRLARAVPAPIVAVVAGGMAYLALAGFDPALLHLADNPLVIGQAGEAGIGGAALLEAATMRWQGLPGMGLIDLERVFVPALMLAVLLSIDTLKTCVVMDAVTRGRHDSNRVLLGQGGGNLCAALAGGLPGAGTLGATLVNVHSGAQGPASALFAGVFALLTVLLLGGLVAWMPLAALAGILCVVGFRLIDWRSLYLLRQRSTVLDFVVIALVTSTAIAFNLMAAAGVGVALAILLFVREEIRHSVVRRVRSGSHVFSKRQRLPEARVLLEARGGETVVFELHGALFFGTTDQLLNEVEPRLGGCRQLVLDLKRVHSVDFSAVHLLQQIADRLAEQGAVLALSQVRAPILRYFEEAGLLRDADRVRLFDQLDDALEWAEERILTGVATDEAGARSLALGEVALFSGLSVDTLGDLEQYVRTRECAAGERIFAMGEEGDALLIIRRGLVRIELPMTGGVSYHIASFGRGDFFGEMAFLDQAPRSADAVALTPVSLFVFSRADFDAATATHPRAASLVATRLARALAERLRQTDVELRVLEEA